jgi:hypothetical protein
MLIVIIIVTTKIKPYQITAKKTEVVQILNVVDSRDTPIAGIIKLSSYFEWEYQFTLSKSA